MKWAILLLISAILGTFIWYTKTPENPREPTGKAVDTRLRLSSPAFNNNDAIPDKYTCKGANVSPPLTVSDVPAETKSLAIIVDDPDAPVGVYTHWIIWNIKPQTTEIEEGKFPEFSQEGTNSSGKIGYTGPCPPSKHRYFFKLYALDTTVGLDGKAKSADLEKAINGHTIAETYIIGIYGK